MNERTSSEPIRAFLGFGSNLGDRHDLLFEAVADLPEKYAVSGFCLLYTSDAADE